MDLITETQEIKALHFETLTSIYLGSGGITKIIAYAEAGEMSNVPWFEVWKDEVIYSRVNAAKVAQVEYK